ncbi:MAG TPA: sensor histidine kinase [Flavobacteriaceae bacterium]|nr:sensor histidine kinase [Flavobacteriaceae bacterium]
MNKTLFFLGFFLLFWNFPLFSQTYDFEKIAGLLERGEIDSSLVLLGKKPPVNSYQNGLWHFYQGKALWGKNKNAQAYSQILQAKTLFQAMDSLEKVSETNLLLLNLLSAQKNLNFDEAPLIQELEIYAKNRKDPLLSARLYANIASKYLDMDNGEQSLHYYDKAISELKEIDDSLRIAKIEINIGAVHGTVLQNLDSALYYYKKALPLFKEKNLSQLVSYSYNNIAEVYKKQENYSEALEYYTLANAIGLKEHGAKTRVIYYENLIELYEKMGNYREAFRYSKKAGDLRDSINVTAQNIAISEIQTKYETAKKEKENLQLKTKIDKKTRTQTVLWAGLLASLLIGGIIIYLISKNAKKQGLIAQQKQEIELRKVEKSLKEQELATIDTLVSAQEKERQRLANDLHDNLGSTLATLKLNFKSLEKHLADNKAKPIMENSSILINDAYKKVREIAHEKSSGVIAKEGLLPAVEQLARKISSTKELTVEVQDFGLDKRLDNTFEIAVFRIIQELATNIIKHAKATEATISLTNHDDLLNIIVEDNGKGFDPKKTVPKDGMGLANIEKRVEHMEGTLEVDSSKKGTSIIIDLPL